MTNPTIDPISYKAGIEAAETQPAEHVARFWDLLRNNHVRILVDMRREIGHDAPDGPSVYWDGSSFGNDTARMLLAEHDRSLHRTEPQTEPDEPTVSDIELLRKCLTQAGEAAPPGIEELGAEFLPHARRVFRYVERLASRNAAPADAERLALVEENKRLRQIISGCAAALPNGAVCSPECSLDFMQHLPGEIAACYTRLRAGGWREDMENGRHGFIVSSADETRFRFWDAMGPTWTTDRVRALRFARRIDAERFAAEDEDAWKILEVAPSAPKNTGG